MNCNAVSESLALYVYGELEAAIEDAIEQHLHACRACKKELDAYRRLTQMLDAQEAELPAAMAAECRRDLMRAIARQDAPALRQSPWREFRRALGNLLLPLPRWRTAVAAAALVVMGFAAARLTTPPGSSSPPQFSSLPVHSASLTPEMTFSTIRSVQPDSAGRVQIAVDETRRRTVSGSLSDEAIQRLLVSALQDEANPGVRVESMDLLKDHPVSSEVKMALLEAVQHDPNPGVRLKALEGLKSMSADAATRSALVKVLLNDGNAGVRVQAIDLLMAHRDDSMVGILQNVVKKDDNNYVRLRCKNALLEMNASVGTF